MLDAVLKSVVGRMDDVRWAEEIGVFRQVTRKKRSAPRASSA